jgi:tRNA (mo5U34)-methyltransferase
MFFRMSMSVGQIRELMDSVPVWHHCIELAPGIITPAIQQTQDLLAAIDLPEDMSGFRVLDLGARDGFFSFECEKRGAAEVIAVDYAPVELTGFAVASKILNSKVKWLTANVYRINELNLGKFDLILFLGVIYHLRNPYLAIDRIYDALKIDGKVIVESHVIDGGFVDENGEWMDLKDIDPRLAKLQIAQFYQGGDLGGDHTSPCAPSLNTLEIMFQNSGFKIDSTWSNHFRGGLTATAVPIGIDHPRYVDSSSESNPNTTTGQMIIKSGDL